MIVCKLLTLCDTTTMATIAMPLQVGGTSCAHEADCTCPGHLTSATA